MSIPHIHSPDQSVVRQPSILTLILLSIHRSNRVDWIFKEASLSQKSRYIHVITEWLVLVWQLLNLPLLILNIVFVLISKPIVERQTIKASGD